MISLRILGYAVRTRTHTPKYGLLYSKYHGNFIEFGEGRVGV
jgi:hypothetical protein